MVRASGLVVNPWVEDGPPIPSWRPDVAALSPDGRTAYVVHDGRHLFVADVRRAKPRRVAARNGRALVPSYVYATTLSPNGRWLYASYGSTLTSVGNGSGVQVLSLAKPRQPRRAGRLAADQWFGDIATTPNGKRLITTSSHTEDWYRLYDVRRPARPRPIGGKRMLSFDPGALVVRRGVTLIASSRSSDLRIARVATRSGRLKSVRSYPAYEDATGITTSPDGHRVYVSLWGGTGEVGLLELRTQGLRRVTEVRDVFGAQSVTVPDAGPTRGRILFGVKEGAIRDRAYLVVLRHV